MEDKEELNTVIVSLFLLTFVFFIAMTAIFNNFKEADSNSNYEKDPVQEQTQFLSDSQITRLKSICDADSIDKNKKVQLAMEYSNITHQEFYDVDQNDIYDTYCDPDISPYGY